MTTLRRLAILVVLAACLLGVGAGLAFAGEPAETTTTTIGEGPTEITVPTTDPNLLGPDAPELPETGAGPQLGLIVVGGFLIAVGVGSAALAIRAPRR